MKVVEEHPCDFDQPYDDIMGQMDTIYEDRYINIFKHINDRSHVYIWYPYLGKGMKMHQHDWGHLKKLLDI